ncbi:MAG: hypothetical protein LBS79_11540, partial [Tannerella sp.]|nr:hypothetical protein [Tannerella sp.]
MKQLRYLIPNDYMADPAVHIFDGKLYIYPSHDSEPSLCPKVVLLSDDMLEFAEDQRDVVILDENGKPLTQGDTGRRFFEASWMHTFSPAKMWIHGLKDYKKPLLHLHTQYNETIP